MSGPRLHRLANGARVVCDPMPGLRTLALSVAAGRGARSERPGESGWAHLLEHMTFKGAGARSARDIVEAIEAAGGQINAATGYERTSFQVRALAGGLGLGMDVLADLVLRPRLDAEELEREKSVVEQEIAEARDTPDDHVFEMAQALAFDGQALGRSILGSPRSVAAAAPGTLSAFRGRLYGADRLVISAAGAVDEDELLQAAEAAFGDAAPAAAPEPEPPVFVGGAKARARRLEQAHLVFLLPGVGARHEDYFVQRLFAEALGGGMSSRLFQQVREALGLAYAVDAYAESYAEAGVVGIYAGTAGADAARAAEVAGRELVKLAEGPDEAELARCKAQLKGALFMARESPLARAEQAAGQTLLFDRLVGEDEIAGLIDAVGPGDLRRFARRMLDAGRSAGAVLGPRQSAPAVEAFRTAVFA